MFDNQRSLLALLSFYFYSFIQIDILFLELVPLKFDTLNVVFQFLIVDTLLLGPAASQTGFGDASAEMVVGGSRHGA